MALRHARPEDRKKGCRRTGRHAALLLIPGGPRRRLGRARTVWKVIRRP